MTRRMTFDEFLKLLPKTGWELRDGEIERVESRRCPWLFVLNMPGVCLGVGCPGDRETIFNAADNKPGHNPEIRRRLLEACGLKERV